MARRPFDPNANSLDRIRRSLQKMNKGAIVPTIPTGTFLAGGASISTTAPLTGGAFLSTNPTISIPQATSTVSGYLLSTDWTTFNSKLAGNTALATTSPLAGGGNLSTGLTLSIPQATSTTNGYLSSTDWNTFNNKGNGTVTSVALATVPANSTNGMFTVSGSPITSAGTFTLTMAKASGTQDGYLAQTDWNVFNGKVSSGRKINTTAPLTGGGDLSADRTLAVSVMGASGSTHASGVTPDTPSTAGSTLFLREDGTWATPGGGSGTVTSVAAGDASITIGGTSTVAPTVAVHLDPNGGLSTGTNGLLNRLLYVNTADSSALNNITTATAFNTSTSLPANFFTVGKTLRITASGSITPNASQQVALFLVLNNNGIQTINFQTTTATLRYWVEMIAVCRTTGVSGSFHMVFNGVVMVQGVSSTALTTVETLGTTLDTTNPISVQAKFAATVANNVANVKHMSVEVMN